MVGGPLNSLLEDNLMDIKMNRLSRWELIQCTVQDFWKWWTAEYLTNLQSRTKWKTRQPNLQIGDLVLVKEDNLLPLKWKTGRMIETHTGKDGLMRIVSVRTTSGTIKRAIAKLCKLPCERGQE